MAEKGGIHVVVTTATCKVTKGRVSFQQSPFPGLNVSGCVTVSHCIVSGMGRRGGGAVEKEVSEPRVTTAQRKTRAGG